MTTVMRESPECGDSSQLSQQLPHINDFSVVTLGSAEPSSRQLSSVQSSNATLIGQDDVNSDVEPEFPHLELARLDDKINRPPCLIPVLPNGELEVLFQASIKLCREGIDTKSEACQRFFRDGLTVLFTKLMTDEALSGWEDTTHKGIFENAKKLMELCVVKLPQHSFALLKLQALMFDPHCKFHLYNSFRPSETAPTGSTLSDDILFAKPPDTETPFGWLVDLVNTFGYHNGFQILLHRFTNDPSLSVLDVAALLKPFGHCTDVLTPTVLKIYMLPIMKQVFHIMEQLTDEELNESMNKVSHIAVFSVIEILKQLFRRLPNQGRNVAMFRLKMILRLLRIPALYCKMQTLNELNKVISELSDYSRRNIQYDEGEWITVVQMAEWIQENDVLSILLRDTLHNAQYVEKLEIIFRFMITENVLSKHNVVKLWEVQGFDDDQIQLFTFHSGENADEPTNIESLMSRLAWEFSPEQQDRLLNCFQVSWTNAAKKQRGKLLKLISRLVENDKKGRLEKKVLDCLWNLAKTDKAPKEIVEQILNSHIRILMNSSNQLTNVATMLDWFDKFAAVIKNDNFVLPALKQIRRMCQLFPEAPDDYTHVGPYRVYFRHMIIGVLQSNYSIVLEVVNNLKSYMRKARRFAKEHPDVNPADILHDGRVNHLVQVRHRLRFIRFILKDGRLWLEEPAAEQIWQCLAQNAVYSSDKDICYTWFSKLLGDEQDFDPMKIQSFFENNVMQLDPSQMTMNAMHCFERCFTVVNCKENIMDDPKLVGYDNLLMIVTLAPNDVSSKATLLLKETFTNVGPWLNQNHVAKQKNGILTTMNRLKALHETISMLESEMDSTQRLMPDSASLIRHPTLPSVLSNKMDFKEGPYMTHLRRNVENCQYSSPTTSQNSQSDETSTASTRSSTASVDYFADAESCRSSTKRVLDNQSKYSEDTPANENSDREFDDSSQGLNVCRSTDETSVKHTTGESTRNVECCVHIIEQTQVKTTETDNDQICYYTAHRDQDVLICNIDLERYTDNFVDTDDEQTYRKTTFNVEDGLQENRTIEQSTSSIESGDTVHMGHTPNAFIARGACSRYIRDEPGSSTIDTEAVFIDLQQNLTEETFALTKAAKIEIGQDVFAAKKAAKRARRSQRICERIVGEVRNEGNRRCCAIL